MLPADVKALKEELDEELAKMEPDKEAGRAFLEQVGSSSQMLTQEAGRLLAMVKLQEAQKTRLLKALSDNGTIPASTPVDYATVAKGDAVLVKLPELDTFEDGKVVCKVPMGVSARAAARAVGVYTLRNRGESNHLPDNDMDTAEDRILVAIPNLPSADGHAEYGPYNGVFRAVLKADVFPDT